jgi:arylsulfatase A-like enzyme
MGRAPVDPLEDAPVPAAEDARADALRRSLAQTNVLFVIFDAARAREVGAYGYALPTTPEIDRIAREGVQFQRAFTPAVHTLGAMSSVWTSQHPDRNHSEVSFSSRLPKDKLTLAEVLSGQGIHTAGFVANAVAGAAFGFERGFAEFDEVFRRHGSGAGGFRKVLPGFFEKNKDRRFFAYVHFREPHFPYDPDPPFDTRFGPEGPIPKAARAEMSWIVDVNQGRRSFTPAETAHLVRLYDGNLAFADQELGALRKSLEALGLWERTVVILAADHGEQLYEHGSIGHNTQLFDDSMRVPLLLRFPAGKGPAGIKVDALVDLLDVAPTIADVFGVLGKGGSDREFRGRSLLPVALGAPGKAAVLSRTVWDRPRYGLRDARYKFVFDTRSGEEQLFDLESDPGETRSRAALEPVRAAYYRQALYAWMARLKEHAEGEGESALTKEQRDNLCALGYLTCR